MARWWSPHLVPSDPGVPYEGLNDGAEVPQLLRVLHQLAAGVLVQLETRQVEQRGGHPEERIWFCPKKFFSYSNTRYSLVDILLDLHHLLPGPVQEEAQGAAGLAVLSCNDEFRKIWVYCVVLFCISFSPSFQCATHPVIMLTRWFSSAAVSTARLCWGTEGSRGRPS